MRSVLKFAVLLAVVGLTAPVVGQSPLMNGPTSLPTRHVSYSGIQDELPASVDAERTTANLGDAEEVSGSQMVSPDSGTQTVGTGVLPAMKMPPTLPKAACCELHGGTGTPATGVGNFTQLSDNVVLPAGQGIDQSVLTSSVSSQPLVTAGCPSCGGSCQGICQHSMGTRLGSRATGLPLGSNFANAGQSAASGPMYAFFDFGGTFSENGSAFSTAPGSVIFGHKDAFLFGAGLGRYLTPRLRVDLSARNRYVELEDQEPDPLAFGLLSNADGGDSVWTVMLTGRYDLPGPHPCIKPYLSSGIGLAYHRAQATTQLVNGFFPSFPTAYPNDETNEFAWSAGAGIAFKMTQNMFFDLDYQYIDMGDAATGNTAFGSTSVTFNDLTANEIAFRLRFNF